MNTDRLAASAGAVSFVSKVWKQSWPGGG
ncbi:hypothetical protein IL54_1830 [Sphingobium sp. ba1]|nr:hypothetical protein IL54_1830 [Sphingobium sp. ba1]